MGAGLPAMQTPRSSRYTEAMQSPASQLLQWTV
ncbi:transposase, partial [Pseudomonas sp. GP01-A6]